MFAKIILLYNDIDEMDTTETIRLQRLFSFGETAQQFTDRVNSAVAECQATCKPIYHIYVFYSTNITTDGAIDYALDRVVRGTMA